MTDSPIYNFDLLVQKKFLSMMIYDESWGRTTGIEVLRPEYFDSAILVNICKWIHYCYKHYTESITPTVLYEKAKEFAIENRFTEDDLLRYREMIDDIYSDTESNSYEFLKEKAIAFARKAAFYEALLGAKDIFDKTTNYEDALRLFKDALNVGTEQDLGLDFNEATLNFINMIGSNYSKENMIQTGIPGWDDALGGGFVKDNFHLIGACFTGNTKIKTNQGNKSFEELEKLSDYSDLEIYSINKNKEKIKSKIKDVFVTKEVDEIIYLQLNNGKNIKCTLDHKFVIKNPKENDPNIIWENGIAYKEAQYLEEDDEL